MPRSSSGSSGASDHPDDGDNDQRSGVTWTTGWQRLSQTFLRPPDRATTAQVTAEPADYSRLTDEEKRQRIVTLHPTERKVAIGAAIFTAVLALVMNVPQLVKRTAVTAPTIRPTHGRCPEGFTYLTHGKSAGTCHGMLATSHYVEMLVLFLVLALAIAVTVFIRRRSAVSFAVAITGVAFGSIFLLIPYVAVAGWVFLRGYRTQKYGAPNVKSPMPGYVAPAGRGTTRRAKSAPPRGGRGGGRGGTTSSSGARKPPQANKRYTPKTPPKPTKGR